MSSSFDHPLHPDDPGISRTLIATTWPFTCLSIIFVSARVYVRLMHTRNLSSDDWVMVFAVALQIIYQGLLTVACDWGFGMATSNMTLEQYKQSHKYVFATQTPGTLTSLVARVSIVILLIRIFGMTRPWFKWFLVAFTALQAVAVFLNLAFEWAWMTPIAVHWDPTVKATRFMDTRFEEYSAVAWLFLFAISDIVYVLFPVMFFWKLNMPVRKRLGLILLMAVSFITFTAAVLKMVISIMTIRDQASSLGPSANAIVWITSTIEQALVISMGCVPALRPITEVLIPTWVAIGDALTSLIWKTARRSKDGGSQNSDPSKRTGPNDDIELGPKVRISDGMSGPGNAKTTNPAASVNLRVDDSSPLWSGIHRTDEYGVTYADQGGLSGPYVPQVGY